MLSIKEADQCFFLSEMMTALICFFCVIEPLVARAIALAVVSDEYLLSFCYT
ncbi:hypothetical protein SeseC_01382 [Streptococcus equi subsp. zooepidemicus ATCC 35246]|nr:hypothetical protein SeseC_01382 [Streptococcus equi subsp. zooepidemicus ATCC 35246]